MSRDFYECASWYRAQNIGLVTVFNELYKDYGIRNNKGESKWSESDLLCLHVCIIEEI